MAKKKSANEKPLPTVAVSVTPATEVLGGDVIEVQESESTTVASEVEWVTIRVPVFTGDLRKAHIPDRMFTRVVGRTNREAVKRVAWALEREGLILGNGKTCTGTTQEVGQFLLEQVSGQV